MKSMDMIVNKLGYMIFGVCLGRRERRGAQPLISGQQEKENVHETL